MKFIHCVLVSSIQIEIDSNILKIDYHEAFGNLTLVRARIEQFRTYPMVPHDETNLYTRLQAHGTLLPSPLTTSLEVPLTVLSSTSVGYTRPYTLSDDLVSWLDSGADPRPEINTSCSNEAFDCRFPALKNASSQKNLPIGFDGACPS